MRSWPTPFIPQIPGQAPEVRVRDTATGQVLPVATSDEVSLYVCGITPYDATHLGHAATYVTFDLLGRVLRDSGHRVRYVQNITDIDDPLLERAERDGIPWQDLATREIALFREDMTALGVIPPDEYLGAVESIPTFVAPIERLVADGLAYAVPAPDASREGAQDVYFEVARDPRFGSVSHLDEDGMLEVFAERGGDPDREGKRGRLDALLWRAHREGEPEWDGGVARLGPARLAHRVRLHRPRPPRGARRRAGRRHRPDLPAPRDERRARSRPRAARPPSRGSSCTRAWSGSTARR